MLGTARGLTAGRLPLARTQRGAAPSRSHVGSLLLMLLASLAAAPAAHAVHIVLVGDSTVSETDGWGPGFAQFLDKDVKLSNRAKNGRSSASFIKEGLWDEALTLDGDYYLIQFGHNDEPGKPGRSTEPDEYRTLLTRYVDDWRGAGSGAGAGDLAGPQDVRGPGEPEPARFQPRCPRGDRPRHRPREEGAARGAARP